MAGKTYSVDVVDVSGMNYPERLAVISLQGLVNRRGPRLFLDYGIYDDPAARETNEVFLPDDIWFEKYRTTIGNQDRKNLEYYRKKYNLDVRRTRNLQPIIKKHAGSLKGIAVWDPEMPDTVNIAIMMSGLDDLLVVHPDMLDRVTKITDLKIVKDFRGQWRNRVRLYKWAFENLFHRCSEGRVACIEPGWDRPEFLDYIVQNRIFVYSLTTLESKKMFSLGQLLLILLVGGPFTLRNLLFNLRLDGLVKRFGLFLMGLASRETRLATGILRSVKAGPFPTIFGWHTKRDDEFSFMLHLSAAGLRLVPSHLAGNFSFHSRLPGKVKFRQKHASPDSIKLQKDKIYLTFTLSDGDQLVLMNTAELGNWRRKERGRVAFNWEMQPLLAELAPALLGQYYETLKPGDYMIAGPSGAGYIVPPLVSNLKDYLNESWNVCRKADVRVLTSYIGDPPMRVVRQHGKAAGNFIGYLAGYLHFGRTPEYITGKRAFIANKLPHLDNINDDSGSTLEAVRKLVEASGPAPCFIGVHLFAYRTTIKDVYNFVKTLDPERVKVVRADEFLLAAQAYLSSKI